MTAPHNFVNAKGTKYIRSKNSVGAQFKDRWVFIRKLPDGLWMIAWHRVETHETAQFIIGDVNGPSMNPILAWHVANVTYREVILKEKTGSEFVFMPESTPTKH